MFPLLDILFNTILPDLFILLILGVKRYLVLNCLSLVTAYHIYLPSVLLLLWNVFIIGGDFSIGLPVFAYWISGTPDISWNWILCSLFVLVISLWLAFIIFYSFFFFLDEQKFSILTWTGPSFLSRLALFPLFMLFGLTATYLGQETHRGQNLLWVLGAPLWIPTFTPSSSLRVY